MNMFKKDNPNPSASSGQGMGPKPGGGGGPMPPQMQPGGQSGGGPQQVSPTNVSVLVFVKSLAAPIVLFSENPVNLYEEIKQLIKSANPAAPKLVEKPGVGPLKKVCLQDTEISGVALQMVDPNMMR